MLAAVLALGASAGWGIADFLGGLKSRTVPVLAVIAIAQPVGLALVATSLAVGGTGTPPASVLWAAPAAVLGTLGIAAFYRGMAVGTISIVAPIAATGAAIPVIVGIASGDRPTRAQLVGFVLAIGGSVLASAETNPQARGIRVAAGVPWAIVASIGFGAYFVPMHAASRADFLWAAFVFKVVVATMALLAVVVVRPTLRLPRRDLGTIACIGVFDSGANVLFAASASLGLVSVVSVLASLYPVATVALAWLYLRERLAGVQAAGVVAALAGVILISAA